MPTYHAPLDDIRFVLEEILGVDQLADIPAHAETADTDLIRQVLEEGAKLSEETLFPLNITGDEEGCHFNGGEVTTPKGFKQAYETFIEGGWPALAMDPDYGGMGMPQVVNFVMQEILSSANMAFGMYPGLSQGAYDAIYKHGSDEQKHLYLPKLAEGTWSGTMNLTEPQCGTDLGLIRTKAEPAEDEDGAYLLTGQKIYISAGEHDLTENIVHLVLARLPDAPEGVKGISLFVVPKYLPETKGDDVTIGARNSVACERIEKKMGIKASATCVMNYEGARGWLVGAPHKGLRAMFTMMNAARLGVGMQGLGIAETAYQTAVEYAHERLQMRGLNGPVYPDERADPIIVHPDVRRMLLKSRAFTEGARALAYWVGMNLDYAERAEDKQTRESCDDLVALMTPIIKAYLTDMGSEVANLAVQVHGGHGYIHEYGVEQYVRDARITQIYEGTNGIQALDLVARKMSSGYGRMLRRFFHPVQQFIEAHQGDERLQEFIFPLAKAFSKLQQSTAHIAQQGLKDGNEAGAASSDYLHQFALIALAYMWARQAKIAQDKIERGEDTSGFYAAKLDTARFFMQRMLPEADGRFKMIMAGAEPVMALDEAQF